MEYMLLFFGESVFCFADFAKNCIFQFFSIEEVAQIQSLLKKSEKPFSIDICRKNHKFIPMHFAGV